MELVGRQWEMAEADRFLDGVADGPPAALVLEGEPESAKTVWRAIVDSAQHRSYQILLCRSSESERALVSRSRRPPRACPMPCSTPFPTAAASAPVRLAAIVGEGFPDRVAVARGTLAALRAAAAEAPTLVAIDDAQWLDPPSVDVLRFVVHRLTAERLGMLVSARPAPRWSSTAVSPRTA